MTYDEMINRTLRYIMALWLLFLVGGLGSWGTVLAEQQDITIISQDNYGVTLEMTLPPFETEAVNGPEDTYQKIRLDGWAKTSKVGHPELPMKTLLLQVPAEGGVQVQVLEDVYETLTNREIYPVPKLGLSEEGEQITEFVKDADAYNASSFYPGELAFIRSGGVVRGTSVARLEIYPFQWNPNTKELRYYKKIRLIIQFDNPSFQSSINNQQSTISVGAFDRLKKKTIINYTKEPIGASRQSTIINHQSSIANTALRMEIRAEGIYHLTYEYLTGAGLPAGIEATTLQLFNLGNEAAMKVVSPGGVFASGDYIEFYAEAVDNDYTGTNVYWLYWGLTTGKRMGKIDGTITGGGTKPGSFTNTVRIEENHTLWEGMPGAPEADYWFWEKMTAPKTSNYTFDIPSPDTAVGATVKVCFRGRSTAVPHPNHHTLINLNSTGIGNDFWDGDISYIQEMTVSPGSLINGSNTVTVNLPGDTGAVVDVVYFNWIEVSYERLFEAVNDELKFTVTGNGKLEIEVKGLTGPSIRLFDITNPAEVKEVVNISITSDGPAYKATFESQVAGAKTFYILTAGRMRLPHSRAMWQSAGLESTANGADWIAITARDFVASVEPLGQLRQNQGLRTKVVSIEDIYNEFNFGLTDPKAIKGFLQYAYDNWGRPAPTYVFLIGDANTDYRDYFGTGKGNIVPPHLSHTSLGVTPTDNWYVCMDGSSDLLPDMFIGRIPADSAAMVSAGVNKITGFENSTWDAPEKVLLAADNNEMAFENLNEALVPYLPSAFGVKRVYLRLYANVDLATDDIVSSIDQGMMVTNYVGHGSVTNWTGEYMFDSEDVPALTNSDRLTFVAAMNCLNGYFSQPFYYCLAEEFVAAQGKGAIGVFSPSGLTYLWEHKILDPELFSILFDQENSMLGPLTTQAKIAAYARGVTEDVVTTFTLFGDPACRLKMFEPPPTPTIPPTAVTLSGKPITASSAILYGTVNPNGLGTTYYFEYGTTAGYGSSTATESAGSGTNEIAVNAAVQGLTSKDTYHFRIVANNNAGTSFGDDKTFSSKIIPPTAVTLSGKPITASSAILYGTVNPNGLSTTYYFEYGTTSGYGSSTATESVGSGTNEIAVNATVQGLTSKGTYHFRIVANNNAGTSFGDDKTFSSAVIYVDPAGICNGNTPCYFTVQNAIEAAVNEAIIKVAAGTYDEDIDCVENKEIAIMGGYDSAFTTQSSVSIIKGIIQITKGTVVIDKLELN